ncbi:MAG: hypothetical protein R3D59_01030 [Paracoccaceae bacterium]
MHYYKFKEFAQAFDTEAMARLDGMKGGLSTRMGAALRHAGAGLLKQPERRKLILLVTDGAPADIDERDPQHLRYDTPQGGGRTCLERGLHLLLDPRSRGRCAMSNASSARAITRSSTT